MAWNLNEATTAARQDKIRFVYGDREVSYDLDTEQPFVYFLKKAVEELGVGSYKVDVSDENGDEVDETYPPEGDAMAGTYYISKSATVA